MLLSLETINGSVLYLKIKVKVIFLMTYFFNIIFNFLKIGEIATFIKVFKKKKFIIIEKYVARHLSHF